jgi:hypothetical protein
MKVKRNLDMEFLKDFMKYFLSLLFALATLLLGAAITDFITPEDVIINPQIAEQNITKFIEMSNAADRASTIAKAQTSIYIAAGIIISALAITLLIAWRSEKRR